MIIPDLTTPHLPGLLLIGFFLYVETHYRIGRLPSRYFRRRPEILFDIPHRIAPGADLPLLLIIKDADRYPVVITGISAAVKKGDEIIYTTRLARNDETVDQPLWWRLFHLPVHGIEGTATVEPLLTGRCNGRRIQVRVDNYPSLSHTPLQCRFDQDPLPGSERWLFGDLHYHSHLTSDQVEFGAPPAAAAAMAEAMGLDFMAVTDHSYDLDDRWDDYLRNDEELGKWKWLQEFTRAWNAAGKRPIILAGEELSAGNSRGRNVHFLIYNEPAFFPGWGDSAEKWLQTRPQWTISGVLDKLSPQGLAFAGHAATPPPRLQRLFLGRDHWRAADYDHPRLDGVQMWNSRHDPGFARGLAVWQKLLLAGRRPVLIGGNDAHGDFGRWRQIAIPFISLQEREEHLFGQVRTGILRPAGPAGLDTLLHALRSGRCLVTSGPSLGLELIPETGPPCTPGDTCTCLPRRLLIQADSTPEFGPLTRVTLCIGDLHRQKETRRSLLIGPAGSMNFTLDEPARELPGLGYLRLEVSSERDGIPFHCFSNPVFLAWR